MEEQLLGDRAVWFEFYREWTCWTGLDTLREEATQTSDTTDMKQNHSQQHE
jgi:hypothetical protein